MSEEIKEQEDVFNDGERALREGVRPWAAHDAESWVCGYICSAGYPFSVRLADVDMEGVDVEKADADHVMVSIWGGENFATMVGKMVLRMESEAGSDQRPVEIASRLLTHIQNDLAPIRPAPLPTSLVSLVHGSVQKALQALGSKKSGKASKALVSADSLLSRWVVQSGMETMHKSELAAAIRSLAAKSR